MLHRDRTWQVECNTRSAKVNRYPNATFTPGTVIAIAKDVPTMTEDSKVETRTDVSRMHIHVVVALILVRTQREQGLFHRCSWFCGR